MKSVYMMIFASLLVLSIFSFSFASADKMSERQDKLRERAQELRNIEDNRPGRNEMNGPNNQNNDLKEKSLSADELSLSVNDSDIEDSYNKLGKEDKLKKIGFAEVLRGQGWATSGNEGSLISLVFLQQSFAEYNKTSNTTSGAEITRSLGDLILYSNGNYKLILLNQSNDSIEFNVLAKGKEANLSNPSDNSIGTLTLTKVSEFSNIKTWTGELSLENQTWSVSLATDSNTFKGKPNLDEGKKIGFFKRLMFWKK